MPRQNRVSDDSRPRMGNLGRVKAVTSNRERMLQLFQSGLQNHTSVEDILQRNFLAGTPQSTDFCFLRTMSSSSSDSEKSFDSEDSEIYYIAEVETEENDESRLSISQTSSDDDQADLYADDPLPNEQWTVKYQKEVDADKELERTLNDRLVLAK